ncbi:MAG: thrombospondin type 3 repeat-containing protein, partial [Saprospiraceae bacterium]
MKNSFLNLLFCFFLASSLFAQDYPRHVLTVKSAWINFKAPNNDNKRIFNDLNPAFEIGYGCNFHKLLSLDIPIRLGVAHFPIYNDSLKNVTRYTPNQFYGGIDALLNLHLCRNCAVSPFLYGGIGAVSQDNDKFYAQAPLGLGINIRLFEMTHLTLQTDYRVAFEDGKDNWQHAFGIRTGIGKPKDTDKDGVPDKKDLCPDVFGTIMGCPDSDMDGIADKDDKCPQLAGVIENMGCPADSDQDGVYDVDDMCPTIAGTVKGCPDRDKDGIADSEDKCPDQAGPAATMGCPDKDRDGITDKDDKCPDQAGTAATMGCPDRDKDGVADADDKCPDVPGTFQGCPDSDKDGFPDNVDKCPNTPGVAPNGCPAIKVEDKKILDVAMRSVQFQTGTAIITKASNSKLDEVVSVLSRYPEMNLSVQG